MKQINRYNTKKVKSLIGFTNNKNTIKHANKYSNFLGFKSLNITPNVHFEEWGEIAKKGLLEKNKWYYDSEDVEKDEVLQEKKRNYFSEDDSLDEEWENNYRFKLEKNWVGFDEDVSSGQEKMSHKRSIVEMFYSPAVNEFLPKETERLNVFTIEDVPEDISKDDVNQALSKLIDEECLSIEKFKTYKKTNLFVELKSKTMKADFLNPSRLNFGIWLKGKRCDVYDSLTRQRNVFLAKIPRTSNEEEIKTFVNKIMQQNVEITVNKANNNSFCFIEFEKHSNASNFIERINNIGDQFANWGKIKNNKNELYSVLDQSLSRLKERLNIYKTKMMKFQSLLELSGYRFDKNGDLIESDQVITVKQTQKTTPKKSTATKKKNATKKTTKAKVDLSAEDN